MAEHRVAAAAERTGVRVLKLTRPIRVGLGAVGGAAASVGVALAAWAASGGWGPTNLFAWAGVGLVVVGALAGLASPARRERVRGRTGGSSQMPDHAETASSPVDGRGPAPAAAAPAPLLMRVTSEPAAIAGVRRAAEAYAAAAGFSEPAVAEIGLVVNEAMANVIRHAYGNQPGRPIEFDAELADDGGPAGPVLRLRLRDWGTGRMPGRGRGYVPGVPGGLGLVCLREMMDGTEYEPQPGGGMLLTLTKRRGRAASR